MIGENFITLILVALVILALIDLVVGVSNDAVNFLNSAVGSKVLSLRNIIIIASLGILCGTLFSGGIMEIARKGIFVPSQFNFDEIMVILITVMIADVLLLDFFNNIGIPTSTTVSIVFNLLGASFSVAFIKVLSKGEGMGSVLDYINISKASDIILGIVLSVFIAFFVGAIVQFIVRLLITFKFESRPKYISILFGGIATTSIVFFLIIKGLKGVSFVDEQVIQWISKNTWKVILILLPIWTFFSWVFVSIFSKNIYKFIIIIGTFSLAMAFAGNDLVNFIGVPIAGWQSFVAWKDSGVMAQDFNMSVLEQTVKTPTLFLMLSGMVMVLTLWFSKKAKGIIKTSIDLSDQNDTKEKFNPNILSRLVVRGVFGIGKLLESIIPKTIKLKIDKQFAKQKINVSKEVTLERPAFDLVRASVNLMIASILISWATSMKLPLSTTYVTFMVAMGTSFSDRAWGADSAVYRVAGVFNVIGSWFLTAIIAFVTTVVIAYLIHLGGETVIAIMLIAVFTILVKNYMSYNKKLKSQKNEDKLDHLESKTIKEIINESINNVSKVIRNGQKIFENSIDGISRKDLHTLKKSKQGVDKISAEVENLQNNIFYFIKSLEEPTLESSRFYILTIRYFQDFIKSVDYIAKTCYKHVNNNHKGLTFKQIKDLQEVCNQVESLMKKVKSIFQNGDLSSIEQVVSLEKDLLELIDKKVESQIMITTKTDETSPKNTKLYFNILLETKDMSKAMISILRIYHHEYIIISNR